MTYMEQIFDIASRISTPLALAGFIAAAFFLILRQLLRKNIFQKLQAGDSFRIVAIIVQRLFVLSLVALVLGFAGFIVPMLAPKPSRPEGLKQEHESRTRASQELRASLESRALSLEEKKVISEFYDKRSKLSDDWRSLYDDYSRINRAQNWTLSSFQRQSIRIKMDEINKQIESIDDSLSELERKDRSTYRHIRPPLPVSGFRILTDSQPTTNAN